MIKITNKEQNFYQELIAVAQKIDLRKPSRIGQHFSRQCFAKID